jgi:6-phosphogluconolactonase/glucosamine-6-phosphate isomerase/deaminase
MAVKRLPLAVSGGHTPWLMLRAPAGEAIPWEAMHLVQVDERVAPVGDPDRNLSLLRESLLAQAPLRPEQLHAMPADEQVGALAGLRTGDSSIPAGRVRRGRVVVLADRAAAGSPGSIPPP